MEEFIEMHAVAMDHSLFIPAVESLRELVEQDRPEADLQAHIERFPYLLSQQFAHCHHVFPRVRLGERFEVDFFCLDIPSSGEEWNAVEIEPTGTKVITRTGRKTAKLEHALQQVRDWRKWISDNIDYARRPRSQSGLGLKSINARFFGEVIVGRRRAYTQSFNELRQQIFRDELIKVTSWDGVLERAWQRASLFKAFSEGIVRGSHAAGDA